MKRHLTFALALALAGLQPLATSAQEVSDRLTPWTAPARDAAIIEIDGEPITFDVFGRWLLELQGRELRERFAREIVVWRELERLGVAPTHTELAEAGAAAVAERIERAFRGDRAAYEAELTSIGSSPARDLERRTVLMTERLSRTALARATRPAPDDAALLRLHERRFGTDVRDLTVRVLRTLPAVPEPVPGDDVQGRARAVDAARAAARARLAALGDRIRAGADVVALVREHSDDPETRAAGGLLPAPFQRAEWPREVNTALAALAVGEPSEPLFAYGYFNLFVIERAEARPFDAEREALVAEYWAAEPDEGERRAAVARAYVAAEPSIVWLDDPSRAASEARRFGPDPRGLEEPLLRVGDEVLTRGDLALWIARERGADLWRGFVRDWRLARRAAGLAEPPTADAIEAHADGIFDATLRGVYGGDRERMARDHARRGIDEAHLRAGFVREAWRDLTLDALILAAREVTAADVEQLWQERYGPLGKSFDVRLLVRSLAGRDAAEEEARLQSLAREARAGADFGALAVRWSDDERTRAQGGRAVGSRFRHELAPEALLRALEALAPGETSDPVPVTDTEGAAHLVLLHLVGVSRVPLASVADELRRELETRRPNAADRMGVYLSLDPDERCTYHAERLFGQGASDTTDEKR